MDAPDKRVIDDLDPFFVLAQDERLVRSPAPRALDFEQAEFLELLKQVASIARIGVWELNLNTMEPVWSPEVYRIHELPEDEVITLERAIGFYEPEAQEEIEAALQRGIREGVSWDITLPLVTAKGRRIWVRALGSPEFHDGTCVRFFGTFQDITDQRQAEQERLEIERQLIRSQKMEALGTVAGGVAHEFNNILGGVMGALELIRIRFSMPGTELVSYVDAALAGCQRAAGIIRQMLSFSRQECEETRVCDLADVMKEAFPLLRAGATSGVDLQFEIPNLPVTVLGDRSQLYQVLVNLVTNAVQALPGGKGQVRAEACVREVESTDPVCIEGLDPGKYAVLMVSDTGCGISEEVLGRIFDPFFTTKEVGQGTGLGLSVVHGIVRAHAGNIVVETEEGKGTSFSIFLPFTDAAPTVEVVKEDSPLRVGRGQRILLIDDERALATVTEQLLELSGYRPTTETDPRAALKRLAEDPDGYDCLLVDYSMPFFTGPEVISKARELGVTCPVILTTGLQDEALSGVLGDLSVAAVLRKPLPAAEIVATLSRVIPSALPTERLSSTFGDPTKSKPLVQL